MALHTWRVGATAGLEPATSPPIIDRSAKTTSICRKRGLYPAELRRYLVHSLLTSLSLGFLRARRSSRIFFFAAISISFSSA